MKNHRQIPPIEMRNRNADDVEKNGWFAYE
jgi:hypothetical protein